MSIRKRVRRDLRPLSADVGPEDGIDPRFLPRYPGRKGAPGRKSLQLCEQIAHTLGGALAESDDEVLRDLLVTEVAPSPDASHLLVTLAPAPSAQGINPAEVIERLHHHATQLRAEVAAAIHRRRVPQLTYRLKG
jgi:ribosome-binding factor A